MQAIFKEAENGQLQQVKKILSAYPTAVTAKNIKDRTALHLSAASGHTDIVSELLAQGAKHDVHDKDGSWPVHLAAENGHEGCVFELLNGAGRRLAVRARRNDGCTPLHLAAKNIHIGVMGCLMEYGAKADVKDKTGVTPLDLAQGHEEMLQLLVQRAPLHRQNLSLPTGQSQRRPASAALTSSTSKEGMLDPSSHQEVGQDLTKSRIAANQRSIAIAQAASSTQRGAAACSRTPGMISQSGEGSSFQSMSTLSIDKILESQASDITALKQLLSQAEDRIIGIEAEAVRQGLKATDQIQAAQAVAETQARHMEEMSDRLRLQEQRFKIVSARLDQVSEEAQAICVVQAGFDKTMQQNVNARETHRLAVDASLQDIQKRLSLVAAQAQSALDEAQQHSHYKTEKGDIPSDQAWQAQLGLIVQQLHQLVASSASRQDMEELKSQLQQQVSESTAASSELRSRFEQIQQTSSSLNTSLIDLQTKVVTLLSWQEGLSATHSQQTLTLDPGQKLRVASSSEEAATHAAWSTPPGSARKASSLQTDQASPFVQRLEFQNSMQRVEERVREATAKEAAAKNLRQQALDIEEWRIERERKDKATDESMRALEADVEQSKLKIGYLEGLVQDLQQQGMPR
ncbi:hypothetical protein CEUSTIGMA_g7527.t1 [Chlamydomonas eustigma]|uniref:Uncharacterized protein n=1 Tax=Chlamydomonas eustigma TaxID=1157962 RepID=A0A250XB22_9CHLO|nr:hypothetical protein CEUSTIGMA_g7527.t1 [Chlamydomonas eustigma]|eukprot:GAX80089.1 hypothetical protein CEUSTIGMA_g7527.t1 [Chlamydomonas eustigma]